MSPSKHPAFGPAETANARRTASLSVDPLCICRDSRNHAFLFGGKSESWEGRVEVPFLPLHSTWQTSAQRPMAPSSDFTCAAPLPLLMPIAARPAFSSATSTFPSLFASSLANSSSYDLEPSPAHWHSVKNNFLAMWYMVARGSGPGRKLQQHNWRREALGVDGAELSDLSSTEGVEMLH